MQSRFTLALIAMFIFVLPATTTTASTMIDSFSSQYQWDTKGAEGSGKWNSHQTRKTHQEFHDDSGGDPWDIKYLGVDVDGSGDNSQFKFGALGGSILRGKNKYGRQKLYLSDIAINVSDTGHSGSSDPTKDSSGWDYAIRLLGLSKDDGLKKNQRQAHFQIYEGGEWVGSDIYNGAQGHVTDTFKMKNGTEVADGKFSGIYKKTKKGHSVLEGAFDLSLLSLFDEKTGGNIITYLTMSCVNDEVLVHADISPVPLPSAVWLFGSALLGFIGMSRRTRV